MFLLQEMRMMDKMDCLHVYMLYNGKLITEAHLYDLAHSTGINNIEPLYQIVDRRKNLAKHFKYCPLCGIKLNWEKFRKMAYDLWNYSVGVYSNQSKLQGGDGD